MSHLPTNKVLHIISHMLLQSMPIAKVVCDVTTMDFITGLPLSQGYMVIMVVVDRQSKSTYFVALLTSFIASKVTYLFVSIIVRHHGFPCSIVSDCDPIFITTFSRKLFELSSTKLAMSSVYHLMLLIMA